MKCEKCCNKVYLAGTIIGGRKVYYCKICGFRFVNNIKTLAGGEDGKSNKL